MCIYNCRSLESITIPNGVTSISQNALNSYSNLANITIPQNVTSIGHAAFYRCTSLTGVTIQVTAPPTLGNDVFLGTSSNLVIYIPAESVDAYRKAWKGYASKIQPIST